MGQVKELESTARIHSSKKKEVIGNAQREGKTVHFAALTDLCHLKNSELEKKFLKYKGRLIFSWVKDDSGSDAVFTEQGSSASHITANKVLGVIFKLPDCAGKVSEAISAYTKVKMEDAPDLLRLPKSECPTICIRLPRSRCPKSWETQDLVVPRERHLYGHPLAGLLWERQLENILLKTQLGECTWMGVLLHAPRKKFVCVDDKKWKERRTT